MNDDLYKNNQKIIGSIIRINRIKQQMSQKALSKGICVPSYLSRIENGDLLPSDDVISIIFNRLGLTFNDSSEFISEGKKAFDTFFHKLNFNEFDYTMNMFAEIEKNESMYVTSPLIIDYYLAKLARYCSTPDREEFEGAQNILISTFDLLSPYQQFLYNFYVGIDMLNLSTNKSEGKDFIKKALSHKETGHCYFWLSYAYRVENNPIKAYDTIKRALDLYVSEGNIISIMDSYEKIAEVYFMLDNYIDAVHYLEMSLNVAEKLNNKHYIEHLNSMLAWSYYRINDFDKALTYLNLNSNIIDHRMIIPDSVIKCLISFSTNDKSNLKINIEDLTCPSSVEHLGQELANILYKFFNFYINEDNYIKNHIWEGLLIYIIDSVHKLVELKKVFNSLLKEYYIVNRRYKDALFLDN